MGVARRIETPAQAIKRLEREIEALKGLAVATRSDFLSRAPGGVAIYTSNGFFVKDNYKGLKAVLVKVQGGGGAGGGRSASGPSVGAGGGGGGYGEKFILANDLDTIELVQVGAGGAGVPSGAGQPGGASSFGTHITAQGGGGGNWTATASTTATAGVGGSVSGADFSIPGQNGQQGRINDIPFPGSGGSSFLGLGGVALVPGQTGSGRVGTGWGSGGSGASGGVSNQPGGDGRQGIVIVHLFF